jgi:hypothetical protein
MITLDIPHVDTGHTTLTFDPAVAEEVKSAEGQINDLIRHGYAVFVEADGKTDRVTSFDATKGVYKIGDKEVAAEGTTATAVAPRAGGCVQQ